MQQFNIGLSILRGCCTRGCCALECCTGVCVLPGGVAWEGVTQCVCVPWGMLYGGVCCTGGCCVLDCCMSVCVVQGVLHGGGVTWGVMGVPTHTNISEI